MGLEINRDKTKYIVNGIDQSNILEHIEEVKEFNYLGVLIGNNENNIKTRKQQALQYLNKLNPIWNSTLISTSTKIRLYNTTALAIFLYGSQTWNTSTKKIRDTINSFHTTSLRRILGYTWKDHISNIKILEESGQIQLMEDIQKGQMRWVGHQLRRDLEYNKILTLYNPLNGKRGRGRPHRQYWQMIRDYIGDGELSTTDIYELASDRERWRTLVDDAGGDATGPGLHKNQLYISICFPVHNKCIISYSFL